MTIREYLEYTDIYPYSKERFDLQKEIMQLDLIGLQLESYDFMNSNKFTIHQASHLMTESTSIDKYNQLETMYTEKANGILQKIREGILNLFKAFGTFITKLIDKMKKFYSKNKVEYKEIFKDDPDWRNVSDDKMKKIQKIIELSFNKYIELKSSIKQEIYPDIEANKSIENEGNLQLITIIMQRLNKAGKLNLTPELIEYGKMSLLIQNDKVQNFIGPAGVRNLLDVALFIKQNRDKNIDSLISTINEKLKSSNEIIKFNLTELIQKSGYQNSKYNQNSEDYIPLIALGTFLRDIENDLEENLLKLITPNVFANETEKMKLNKYADLRNNLNLTISTIMKATSYVNSISNMLWETFMDIYYIMCDTEPMTFKV